MVWTRKDGIVLVRVYFFNNSMVDYSFNIRLNFQVFTGMSMVLSEWIIYELQPLILEVGLDTSRFLGYEPTY